MSWKMSWKIVVLWFVLKLVFCSSDIRPKRYRIAMETGAVDRWTQVITDHLDSLPMVVADTKKFVPTFLQPIVFWLSEQLIHLFPQDTADEMRGIARTSGLKLGEIVGLNILYDISAFDRKHILGCTSIVAEDGKGRIWHGRNLDYALTSLLRNITIIVDFTRNNKVVFSATTFALYVGVLTGQRPNAFSVSLNERYSGAYIDTILMEVYTQFRLPVTFAVRRALEREESFDSAVNYLSAVKMVAPSYLIVAGTQSTQGVVITRDRWMAADIWRLNTAKNRWFMLETNFDHWKFTKDRRRKVGNAAMRAVGQEHIGPETLFAVLSKNPVKNSLTVFTSIMSPADPMIMANFTFVRYPNAN